MKDLYDVLKELRKKANNDEVYELRIRLDYMDFVIEELRQEVEGLKNGVNAETKGSKS